jgi:hypothetical protein
MDKEAQDNIKIDGVFLNRRGGCSIDKRLWSEEKITDAAIIFEWHGKNGWGETTIKIAPDGTIKYDTECMGEEFIKLLFDKFYEQIKRGSLV